MLIIWQHRERNVSQIHSVKINYLWKRKVQVEIGEYSFFSPLIILKYEHKYFSVSQILGKYCTLQKLASPIYHFAFTSMYINIYIIFKGKILF